MNRFLLLLFYLFIIFFGKSQDVYYYRQSGDKIILNENKLKKYLQINANVSERSKQILLKDIAYYSNLDTLDANLFLCSVCSDYQTEFDSLILFYSKDIKYCSSELSSSQHPDLIQWTTNEIFVEMKPCFLLEDVIAELGVHFNQIRQLHKDCSEYLICVEQPIDVIDIANGLFNSAKVVYAQPSFIRRNTIQNPYYQNQWALHNTGQYYSDTTNFLYDINIIPAWEITKGDSSITIALLDEGVKLEHEDLQNNLLQGKDVFGNKPDGSAASNSTHGENGELRMEN